jgi:hypothetical protein
VIWRRAALTVEGAEGFSSTASGIPEAPDDRNGFFRAQGRRAKLARFVRLRARGALVSPWAHLRAMKCWTARSCFLVRAPARNPQLDCAQVRPANLDGSIGCALVSWRGHWRDPLPGEVRAPAGRSAGLQGGFEEISPRAPVGTFLLQPTLVGIAEQSPIRHRISAESAPIRHRFNTDPGSHPREPARAARELARRAHWRTRDGQPPSHPATQPATQPASQPATQPPSHPATQPPRSQPPAGHADSALSRSQPAGRSRPPPGSPRSQPAGRSHPSSVTSPRAGNTPPGVTRSQPPAGTPIPRSRGHSPRLDRVGEAPGPCFRRRRDLGLCPHVHDAERLHGLGLDGGSHVEGDARPAARARSRRAWIRRAPRGRWHARRRPPTSGRRRGRCRRCGRKDRGLWPRSLRAQFAPAPSASSFRSRGRARRENPARR